VSRKTLLAIGIQLAADDVSEEPFESKASLLDWDIVLFRPAIRTFYSQYGQKHLGKPSLDDTSSFRLKDACEHWRREIKQAFDTGKTVVVFLSEVEEVYVQTGEKQFSGTGRNRLVTQLVSPYSNYSSLPLTLSPINATGSFMKLTPKGAEAIAPFWSEFEESSEYKVMLTAPNIPACIETRDGAKAVGALYRSKTSSGALVLLPDVDFLPEGFVAPSGNAWTKEAQAFAGRLVSSIVALDAALRESSEVTPEPAWAAAPEYSFTTESDLRASLLDAERRVEKAQLEKEALLDSVKSAGRLRALLYEKGKLLELVIIEALRILGFSAAPFKEGLSEFDVVFECPEGRLVGEAEGKDTKAINVDKLRQLAMNLHEDLQRDEVSSPAKAVLFGNGFRLSPPAGRSPAFTEKCISAARSSNTALVSTSDLFTVTRLLLESADPEYSYACRRAILEGVGPVTFPDRPDRASALEIKAQKPSD
jgi:hypothetical protein